MVLSLAANLFSVGYARAAAKRAAGVLLSEIAGSYPPEVSRKLELHGVLRDKHAYLQGTARPAMRNNLGGSDAATGLEATIQDCLLNALRNVNARAFLAGWPRALLAVQSSLAYVDINRLVRLVVMMEQGTMSGHVHFHAQPAWS